MILCSVKCYILPKLDFFHNVLFVLYGFYGIPFPPQHGNERLATQKVPTACRNKVSPCTTLSCCNRESPAARHSLALEYACRSPLWFSQAASTKNNNKPKIFNFFMGEKSTETLLLTGHAIQRIPVLKRFFTPISSSFQCFAIFFLP